MKKYLTIIILVCALNSCKENTNKILLTDINKIVGKWEMCEESGGGEIAKYNQCLTVLFSENGKGSIYNNENFFRQFEWKLYDSILIIKDTVIDMMKPFSDSNLIALQNKQSITKMTITSFDKYNCYFLTKISQ